MITQSPAPTNQETAVQNQRLKEYYSDHKLLYRNIAFIILLTLGWSVCFTFITPLMQLKIKSSGVSDSIFGTISGANAWIYSYLVMYFGWKSDNTVSRFGRRIPYLMIATPLIVLPIVLFPFFYTAWILVALMMMQSIFMDIKAATIPLLNIDCIPRSMIARVNSLSAVVLAVTSFFGLRYGMKLADQSHYAPYLVAGFVLSLATIIAILSIKEPPIRQTTTERFMPWSAMKVAWEDKRTILLMVGVGLCQGFGAVCYTWIWLYASKKLGVSVGELGKVMSWGILVPLLISIPAGCLIDRYRGMRMVTVHWLVSMIAAWWVIVKVHDSFTLTIAAVLIAAMSPFYSGVDVKVYRDADPKHIGSITSTNSCLRGMITGASALISGFLVQHAGGDHRVAFIFGAFLTTCGFLCIFVHSRITKSSPPAQDNTLVKECQ